MHAVLRRRNSGHALAIGAVLVRHLGVLLLQSVSCSSKRWGQCPNPMFVSMTHAHPKESEQQQGVAGPVPNIGRKRRDLPSKDVRTLPETADSIFCPNDTPPSSTSSALAAAICFRSAVGQIVAPSRATSNPCEVCRESPRGARRQACAYSRSLFATTVTTGGNVRAAASELWPAP
jgi:hypothetical protein